MNHIPADLMNEEFDFVWSCCALEHLGTMEKCVEFIFNAMKCLKPGGLAVHTTEYNTFGLWTVSQGSTVFFRKKEIIEIARRLVSEGHKIELNLSKGSGKLDKHYDWPPYKQDNHLKLMVSKQWKFIGATSIGLIIEKRK
jgi:2-polyprenyl-3-methyl-5-hydroxy-6-metoxy-1,4-benzoquinol methylase